MMHKSRFTLTIPIKLSKVIEKIAYEKGVSKNAMMLEILWQYVEAKESEATR